MNEVSEMWRDWKDYKQRRHRSRMFNNTNILEKSGLEYEVKNEGEDFIFRKRGRPKVNFYPSTGRWYSLDLQQTFSGGARKFIKWYLSNKSKGEL